MKSLFFSYCLSVLSVLFFSNTSLARTMVYVSNADDGEIAAYNMDKETGKLHLAQRVKAGDSVMPLAVSPDKKTLYAAIRSTPYSIVSFSIQSTNGELTEQSQAVLPHDICFVHADTSGKNVLTTSYGSSALMVNRLDDKRLVQEASVSVYPTGLYAHSLLLDSSNQFLFVANKGSDQVMQFKFDASTGKVSPNSPASIKTAKESGPRHIRFSPDQKFVYLLNELDGTVNVYAFDKARGVLTEKQSILMAKKPFKEKPSAAEIQITPNGKFVYTSERRTNTINVFQRDQQSGLLTLIESVPTETKPRSFTLSPDGKFLLSAGQLSNHLSVYKIDQSSGQLTHLARYAVGKNPSWVEVVDLP